MGISKYIFLFHCTYIISGMNFQTFDEEIITDLPSCVYANHQLNPNSNNPNNNLRINSNSLRHIQQQYLQHAGKCFI